MNIKQALQIKDGIAVVSSKDMAILLGRKHLSVLRAVDAIPTKYLREGMFIMIGDELFLTVTGLAMLNLSKRHRRMRLKVMLALFTIDDSYQEKCRKEFDAAMPRTIAKLILWLGDIGSHGLAMMVFKVNCWLQGYAPYWGRR